MNDIGGFSCLRKQLNVNNSSGAQFNDFEFFPTDLLHVLRSPLVLHRLMKGDCKLTR